MNRIVAWLLVFLYGVALLKPVQPLVEYYVNQDFFANVLCVNQDKPDLACNGHCILMQKLKKAAKDPVAPAPFAINGKVNLKDYPIGFVSFLEVPLIPDVFSSQSLPGYAEIWPDEVYPEIFHPPV